VAFRDETEALRARIEALEGELASAQDDLEALEADRLEIEAMRARIAELEAELAQYAPKTRKGPTGPQKIRRTMLVAGAVAGGVVAFAAAFLALSSGPDVDGIPRRGVLELDTSPTPAPVSLAITGEHRVSDFASGCHGYVESQPVVTVRNLAAREVRVWTEGSTDFVLLVHSEDGRVYCDDDSGEGMNARLTLDLPAGDHNVWVGTFGNGAHANATLHVDGQTLDGAGLHLDGEPSLQTVRVAGVDRHVIDGPTSGDVPARLAQEGCLGFVPRQPQVDLDVRALGEAQIVARAEEDLVLLVRRPDGTFICDDDGAGNLDPRLVENLQLGHYQVWVGTYAQGRTPSFHLSVDVDGPPAPHHEGPRLGRWDLGSEGVLSFTEQVSGRTPISTTHPECRNLFGTETPDLELALAQDRTVTFSLTSSQPLGMLIEHPDGTQTCDNTMSAQPMTLSAGSHRVWVGAPTPSAAASFTLMAQSQPR